MDRLTTENFLKIRARWKGVQLTWAPLDRATTGRAGWNCPQGAVRKQFASSSKNGVQLAIAITHTTDARRAALAALARGVRIAGRVDARRWPARSAAADTNVCFFLRHSPARDTTAAS